MQDMMQDVMQSKYKLPDKVYHLFLSGDFERFIYKDILYIYDISMPLHGNIFDNETMNQLVDFYKNLNLNDFYEYISPDITLQNVFAEIIKDVTYYKNSSFWSILKLNNTYYKEILFLIKDGKILKIGDKSLEGISDDIEKFLNANKKNLNSLKYEIKTTSSSFENYFEIVHKYYYYDNSWKNLNGSGAGTLTSWLTEDEITNRYLGLNIIQLNSNYRLIKGSLNEFNQI